MPALRPPIAPSDTTAATAATVRDTTAIAKRAPRRRRKRNRIPKEIRRLVVEFSRHLRYEFGANFATSRALKNSVARLLTSGLPPDPGRPGRPGGAIVTAAIWLRAKLRRSHPERSHKQIWREVYEQIIPRYGELPVIERLDAEHQLRQRVRWRLYGRARSRRARKIAI
jgi:hypothetical protein